MLDKVLKQHSDIPCDIITGLPDQLTTADLEKVAIRKVAAKLVAFRKISEILKSLSA